MNNCKVVYKLLKYAMKSKRYEYIENMNPMNIQELYNECKYRYINQNGGSQQTSGSDHFISMIYHGAINPNETLTVPPNTTLALPLCCGMYYISEMETFEFLHDLPLEKRIERLKSPNNTINVGKQKFLLLREGDRYCNIELSIVLDNEMDEGTKVDDDRKPGKFIPENLVNNKINEIDDLLKIHFSYFTSMQKRIMDENKRKINNENVLPIPKPLKFGPETAEALVFRMFYDIYARKIYEQTKDISDADIFNKCLEEIIDTIDSNKPLLNVSFVGDIPYDKITINYMDIIEEVIAKINNVEYLINEYNIVYKLQNNLLPKHSYLFSIIENDKVEYKSYFSDITKTEERDRMDLIITSILQKIVALTSMDDLEKKFFYEVLSTKNTITLQDMISFYRDNVDGNLFIFNISCQGFGNERVCDAYKCLKYLNKKLSNDELSTETPYFQEDYNIIIEALQYIDDNKLYKPQIDDTLRDIYYNALCAFHKIKIREPEIFAKYFTLYINQSYRPLLDYILSFDGHFNLPIEIWSHHQQFIKTIVNLFITEVANSTEHKEQLDSIMLR